MLITTEIKGYRIAKSENYLSGDYPFIIKDKYEDDAFIVDFVRVYDKEN